MTVVDARFAGGAIIVERDDEYTGDYAAGVRIDLPGLAVWLFAHEAQALAAALQMHAATAEGESEPESGPVVWDTDAAGTLTPTNVPGVW